MDFQEKIAEIKSYYRTTPKKKIVISHLILSFASLLLSCFLYNAIRSFSFSINPIILIRSIFLYGFPWLLFLFFFFLFWVIYVSTKSKNESRAMHDDRNFDFSESGAYGTASVLRPDQMSDIARIEPCEDALGTILGQLDTTGKKVINQLDKSRYNKHIAVFGASQSGKSFCFAIPFVLQAVRRRESIIITDPKGELYRTTVEYCRQNGYVVKRLDLDNMAYSDGWNCANEILTGDDIETRAQIFAHTAIINADVGRDDIYVKAGEALLKAVLLRVALGSDYSSEAPTGSGIRGPKTFAEAYKLLLQDADRLKDEFSEENLLAAGAYEARGPFMTFASASANLSGNIIATVVAGLQLLQNRIVCDITSENDIDLTLPGKRPCAYYVLMSDQHSTFDMLGALFFNFAFLDLVEYANKRPDSRLECPVNFLLDEFANYFQISDFDKKLATVRSRAINISIICQDLPQLQKKYPETWASILSNSATHLCIGFNDPTTEEYYSERSGDATIVIKSEKHEAVDPILTLGYAYTKGAGRRAVYTIDELARMDKDDCLISFQGHAVLQAHKFTYPEHPDSKYLINTNITSVPFRNFKNKKAVFYDAKKFFKDYEENWMLEYARYETALQEGRTALLPKCMTYAELMEQYIAEHPEYLNESGGDWDTVARYSKPSEAQKKDAKKLPTRKNQKKAPINGQIAMSDIDQREPEEILREDFKKEISIGEDKQESPMADTQGDSISHLEETLEDVFKALKDL